MDLSIIIVNWNAAHYLRPCLQSVYRETKGIEFEVIVLDNASYDGSAELVRTEFPQAIFIQGEENLGFTRGNNYAYRYASGRNILLLNPDTEIVGHAITILLSYLESLPRAGAIGGRLLNSDGSIQTSCLQAFPTILNQLLDADGLKKRFPRSRLWGMKPLFRDPGHPVEVEIVCGACLMVKRDIFEQVGLLSLDYLMYGDDLDLCYRIKKAGYVVYYTGESDVIHHGGKSTASWKQSLSDVWIRDSTYKFMAKSKGRLYGAVHKWMVAVVALGRMAIMGCLLPLARSPLQKKRSSYIFMKWKRIFQWAIGLEGWAKSAGEELGFAANEW